MTRSGTPFGILYSRNRERCSVFAVRKANLRTPANDPTKAEGEKRKAKTEKRTYGSSKAMVKRGNKKVLPKAKGEKRKAMGFDRRRTTDKRARIVRAIRALPRGKVSSYGAVARAAGWPGAARQVVRVLREVPGLPWHRVLGSGGAIKLPGESGAEQRFRLRMEGVAFRGARVDMKQHEFHFPTGKTAKHSSCGTHDKRKYPR